MEDWIRLQEQKQQGGREVGSFGWGSDVGAVFNDGFDELVQ